MKPEKEMNRKRLAFTGVLILTALGAVALSQAVHSDDQALREPVSGKFLLGVGVFLLGLHALVFVSLYERVRVQTSPWVGGALFGAAIWLLSAFPIFLFVSASGARSIENYLIASLGSLILFLGNGMVTGWCLKNVSTKALADDSTAIG